MTDPARPDEVLPPGEPSRPWLEEALLVLPNLIKLVSRLLRDPRVPRRRRAFAMVVLGYVLSPVDLVPDMVPVLGQVDDLLLVVLALHHLVQGVSEDVVEEHWDGSRDVLEVLEGVLDWASTRVPWPVRRLVARFVTRP